MPSPPGTDAPRRLIDALRYVGPGLILTAGIVGTGELVLTPRMAAEHGFSLLWLVVLGCVIKVFVQVELGRYAVATGTPTLRAMNDIPGPRLRVSWILWIWLPVFIAMISVVGGILGATAEVLRMAGVDMDRRMLAAILGVLCALLLGSGRYGVVELVCTALVAVFIFATGFAVVALQWTPFAVTWTNIAEGFAFELPPNFATAFAAFGLIGVGAAELMYYPYWCLEKGYGQRVGPRTDRGVWLGRARGWLRVMRVDAWSSMIVYTTSTVAFYLLGAAVLHAKGLEVANQDLVQTLAHMYQETFGSFGLVAFLVGAFAVLYSTAFAGSASNGRLLADAIGLWSRETPDPDSDLHRRRVRWCSIAMPLYATAVYLVLPQPVTLILINGIGQAILLPFLGGLALYLRYRRLEQELRPGSLWTTFLWVSASCMACVGLWQLVQEIARRL